MSFARTAVPRALTNLTSPSLNHRPLGYAVSSLCTRCLRQKAYDQHANHLRLSNRRGQATAAAAHRPDILDPQGQQPPPSRNTGVPETSIGGGRPHVDDRTVSGNQSQQSLKPSQISISEDRAQQPQPPNPASQPSFPPQDNSANTKTGATAGQATGSLASSAPRKSKLRPRKAAMKLTPTAVSALQELLDQPDPKMIRVGVKNRGCSGLAYHLEYVDKPGKFDEAVDQDGVKVLIDSKALFSIIGSEMDWVEDKLSRRFVFRNPNISEFMDAFGQTSTT